MQRKFFGISIGLITLCLVSLGLASGTMQELSSSTTWATGLAWDGVHLWVSDSWTDKVYELDPENGSIIFSFPSPGGTPHGLAWDGMYFWNADESQKTIYKLNPATEAVISSFPSPDDSAPHGLAWDGTYLWCATGAGATRKIYKMDPENGAVIFSFSSSSFFPCDLAWDGAYLWNADFLESEIHKLDPTTGAVIDNFSSPRENPTGLTWDGAHLWCACPSLYFEDMIYELDPATGTVISSFSFPATAPTKEGIFDKFIGWPLVLILCIAIVSVVGGIMNERLAALGLVGGTLATAGVFLPWATVGGLMEVTGWGIMRGEVEIAGAPFNVSVTGVYPWLVLAGGALSLISALGTLAVKTKILKGLLVIGGVLAIIGSCWGFLDLLGEPEILRVSIEYGLYLCIVGGLLALLGGAFMMRVGVKEFY